MYENGFSLYSSWPSYKDNLNIQWIKKSISKEENLRRMSENIKKSRIGYMFGRKHFLVKEEDSLEEDLYDLVQSTDNLIGNFNEEDAGKCINNLQKIKEIVSSQYVLSDKGDAEETVRMISSIQTILKLLISGKTDEVIEFCNKDESFIKNWGMPLHVSVFQKR